MKLGSNDISSVKIGSTDVNKIYIGSTEVWSSFTGLLDTYSGAAAAYSLRQLSSTYSGDSIRVRRASDNAESDIGFVSGQLDTTTLETFCSGTDGFVTTWYDQSGNGYNATQSTSANQPKIVSAGSTILENGKPSLSFDGSDDYLFVTSSTIMYTSNYSSFYTAKTNTVTSYTGVFIAGGNNQSRQLRTQFHLNSRLTEGYLGTSTVNDLQILDTNQSIISIISTGMHTGESHLISAKVNGGSELTSSPTGLITPSVAGFFSIGINRNLITVNNGSPLNGEIQEVIIYNSDQSSNRTGIESNINTHYNIY